MRVLPVFLRWVLFLPITLSLPVLSAPISVPLRYAPSVIHTRKASMEGVKTRVRTVAMPSPKTTAVASCFHQSAVGALMEYPPLAKSIDRPIIIGARPAIVVIVVNKTGRMRSSAVRTIACKWGMYLVYSW